MTGHIIMGRATPAIKYQGKKTVETMTDVEIKHKLCKDVAGWCKACGVYDTCRYGQEADKRGLL